MTSLNAYYEEALRAFANWHGTYFGFSGYWKASLRHAWETGKYPDLGSDLVSRLAQLRDMRAFGPRGLVKYRLPKVAPELSE